MSNSLLMPLLVALATGYFLGSIPFGLLLTRAAGLGDVRNIGSGNIGATNVLRTGNKALAALTLILDLLKGTAAVLFAGYVLVPKLMGGVPSLQSMSLLALLLPWTAGLGAFLGHIFPVWLGFKGGKGVATFIGVLLAAEPLAAAAFCASWLVVALLTRFSSLAALVATMVTFIYFIYAGGPFVTPVVAIISSLLFWKHRENIRRLTAGEESRIGAKG